MKAGLPFGLPHSVEEVRLVKKSVWQGRQGFGDLFTFLRKLRKSKVEEV